jgi:hypothetical protein
MVSRGLNVRGNPRKPDSVFAAFRRFVAEPDDKGLSPPRVGCALPVGGYGWRRIAEQTVALYESLV